MSSQGAFEMNTKMYCQFNLILQIVSNHLHFNSLIDIKNAIKFSCLFSFQSWSPKREREKQTVSKAKLNKAPLHSGATNDVLNPLDWQNVQVKIQLFRFNPKHLHLQLQWSTVGSAKHWAIYNSPYP